MVGEGSGVVGKVGHKFGEGWKTEGGPSPGIAPQGALRPNIGGEGPAPKIQPSPKMAWTFPKTIVDHPQRAQSSPKMAWTFPETTVDLPQRAQSSPKTAWTFPKKCLYIVYFKKFRNFALPNRRGWRNGRRASFRS